MRVKIHSILSSILLRKLLKKTNTMPEKIQIPQRSWIWLLINLTIPLCGVMVLKWNLFGILYFFWMELIALGVFGLLRILTALGNRPYLELLIPRLGSAVFFAVLYGALLMLVIGYSISGFDLSEHMLSGVKSNFTGIRLGTAFLFASYLLEFSRDYLLLGKFRETHPFSIIIGTFVYTLPLACIILFVLTPYAPKAPEGVGNLFLVLGIILGKTLIEFAIANGRSWLQAK